MKLKVCLLVLCAALVAESGHAQNGPRTSEIDLKRLQSDLELVLAEKSSRTKAQEKIASGLLIPIRQARGDASARALPTMAPARSSRRGGAEFVVVDVKGNITPSLLETIEKNGGVVLSKSVRYGILNAELPIMSLEAVAANPDVRSIFESFEPIPQKQSTSEGDVAHQGPTARQTYGITGDGVKVGVISDSADYLADTQATGDLPSVTVVADNTAGEVGSNGRSGEGTAMLEIVHDLAPDAELLFHTGYPNVASMVNAIEGLTQEGSDVIVDDLFFHDEFPFQDDVIAQAAEDAISAGVHYFTSASNYGNVNDLSAAVWEGDYNPSSSGYSAPGRFYQDYHLFSGAWGNDPYNQIPAVNFLQVATARLFWADPLGASSNDYDLLLFTQNNALAGVSSNTQNGDDDARESIPNIPAGYKLAIVRYSGESRFLHLDVNLKGDKPGLAYATSGYVRGQGGAENVFAVAATSAQNRTTAFDGSESVNKYSSDGYRRIFYERDGTPITPGNFSSTGGELRVKPEVTAADGVTTEVPNFAPFNGTSAAAPHAAAIGALLLEADPDLTRAEMLAAFANGALDIEATGTDRDSGVGIITATGALAYVLPSYNVTASANPASYGTANCTPSSVITGGDATCTASPNEGYQFDGWSGACAAVSTTTCELLNITSDKVSTAAFSRILVIPSIPSITSTDYEDGTIILNVSVTDNGGTEITEYAATCTDGTNTFTGTSTSSPLTVAGLTNDVAYTCTVTATNSVGTSTASAATAPITPQPSATGLPLWLLYQTTQ